MTERSAPWAGTGGGHAGPYSDENWADIWKSTISDNLRPNAGVFYRSGDGVDPALQLKATGTPSTNVVLKPGRALVDGKWYENDADLTIAVTANTSGNPRIDRLVLRKDNSASTITAILKVGTPAGSPVAPSLTQSGSIYEIPLAQIQVANLFTEITNGNISNTDREYAKRITREEGGTSVDFLEDEFLIGDGAASGVPIKGRFDHARVLLTHTPGGARATNNISVAGAFQTVPLTVIESNTLGYLSLASNQINIDEAGRYLFLGGSIPLLPPASSCFVEVKLRNVTQGVDLVVSTTQFVSAAASVGSYLVIPPCWFEANTNDKLELQIDGSVTVTITYGSTFGSAIVGDARDITLDFLRIRP